MTNKSDTPRCDKNIVVSVYGEVRVPLEFARQLERELAVLKAGTFTPLPTDEMPNDREWTDIEWMRNQWWMALYISEQDKKELAALKAENERMNLELQKRDKCAFIGPMRDCPTHGDKTRSTK